MMDRLLKTVFWAGLSTAVTCSLFCGNSSVVNANSGGGNTSVAGTFLDSTGAPVSAAIAKLR